jgi:hypothetical protein
MTYEGGDLAASQLRQLLEQGRPAETEILQQLPTLVLVQKRVLVGVVPNRG